MQLRHSGGLVHAAEERAERLAGLEINRAVLYLNNYIITELTVQVLELLNCLVGAVRAGCRIYKGPPHNHSAMRRQCVRQHVCAVNMGATEILRARLALGRCLYQEASEVWDEGVDFICLVLPPLRNCRVQGIGRRQLAKRHGRGEVDCQIRAYPVLTQDVSNLRYAADVLGVQDLGVGVDVVQH